MILRRQRPIIYENQVNKEETFPSLKSNALLKANDEAKTTIKTSENKNLEKNENGVDDKDEIIETEKSLKLDSVKRISRIFEKDSSKERIDSPKSENKGEKEVQAKRWDINPSSVFKEKLKTYQMLLESTAEMKRKSSEKENRESGLVKNIPDEKLSSPEIRLSSKKPKLLLSVEINEKNCKEKETESSILIEEKPNNVSFVNEQQLGKKTASSNVMKLTQTLKDTNSSQSFVNNDQVKPVGKNTSSSNTPNNEKSKNNSSSEIKEKIKSYQMLAQNSEDKKGNDLKKKNSEVSLVKNLLSEKSSCISKQNSLISVEINENLEIQDKAELLLANQRETETLKEVLNSSNSANKISQENSTIITNNNSVTSSKDYNVNATSVLKDKIKAYQMSLESSEEKKGRDSKSKNNKAFLDKKLLDENLSIPKTESNVSKPRPKFSGETNETIEVVNKSESPTANIEEKKTVLESNNETVNEKETSLLGNYMVANKTHKVAKNMSHHFANDDEVKSNGKISADVITSEDITEDTEDIPSHQNTLEKDMPIFESRSTSVKSIISKYQTSIKNNVNKPKIENNVKVLKTQESQSKVSVTNISDVLKTLEIELVENINNDIDKAYIIDANDLSQDNIEKLNNKQILSNPTSVKILVVTSKKIITEPSNNEIKKEVANDNKISPETENFKEKKEVTFFKQQMDQEKKQKESENQKYIVNQLKENINKDESKPQKQASESTSPPSDIEEDKPSSSIKEIIRKAKLEAEKQEKSFKANQPKKSVNKSSAIMKSSKSPEENKVDLNKELEKTFKSRVFHNEVVSSDNFKKETEENISEAKDKTNKEEEKRNKQKGPIFKYKIGETSKEEVLTDWTPVNEVIIKTEDEVLKEKTVKLESKPIYEYSPSELEEITYKNTQINAKVTAQGKSILKTNKPKAENGIENDSKSQSYHVDDNNKNNNANLEKFIARHLEKQMQNNSNQSDFSKSKHPPLKRIHNGIKRASPSKNPVFKNKEPKIIPNGSVVNSDSEKDLPEPDYD